MFGTVAPVRGEKRGAEEEEHSSEEEAGDDGDMALQDQRLQQAVCPRGGPEATSEDDQAAFYARFVRLPSVFLFATDGADELMSDFDPWPVRVRSVMRRSLA